jgi:hypothetical protein
MGLSGKDYDRFSGPDFTPNKDRRMAEWRKKKEAETSADLAERGKAEAARASEAEDKPEGKVVKNVPVTKSEDTTVLNAINNGLPGETIKKPRYRRKHFDTGHKPTLFDDVE